MHVEKTSSVDSVNAVNAVLAQLQLEQVQQEQLEQELAEAQGNGPAQTDSHNTCGAH